MKKYIFTILMAVAAILSVSAQQKLVVKLDNGTTQEFETWEVDSLYFTPSATISSTAPAETEIVDLGFAKWAPYNLGSTKASETGWLVGWGDVTGTNKSTKLKYFKILLDFLLVAFKNVPFKFLILDKSLSLTINAFSIFKDDSNSSILFCVYLSILSLNSIAL